MQNFATLWQNPFNEFTVLIVLAVLIGTIGMKLRQPLILSFIVVGVIAGPAWLGWITQHSDIDVLASFGITLLLFIVGLKLDLQEVRLFGSVALVVGICQVILTALLGGWLGILLGLSVARAYFIGLTLTFSSTIIIIKILSDQYDIDSLYGRLSVGILIIQDIAVVLAIIVLSSFHVQYSTYADLGMAILVLLVKALGLLVFAGLMMRYILPVLLRQIASSKELIILFALSWACLLALVTDVFGFGKEIGGFIAGVTLASSHFREAIISRLETVRNLLLLFFFLDLGAALEWPDLHAQWELVLVFSLFVLIAKPLIVMLLLTRKRFRKRTAFMSGITMGQISEFSLIMGMLGAQIGYLEQADLSLLTMIGIITIGISTYMMAYANGLYAWLRPWLALLERDVFRHEDAVPQRQDVPVDIIIYGYGRHGQHLAKLLRTFGLKIMCVDFDPGRARATGDPGLLMRYGDAEDVEFPKSLPLDQAKWVVSTIPHHDANHAIVSSLRELGYQGKIALSAYHVHDRDDMKNMRVDMIFVVYQDAANSAAERLVASIQGGVA